MDLQAMLFGMTDRKKEDRKRPRLTMPKLKRLRSMSMADFRTVAGRAPPPRSATTTTLCPTRERRGCDNVPAACQIRTRNAQTPPGRKHLPVGSGEFTVGCVDIMSDYGVQGTFIRLYYPTKKTDVFTREAQWPLWLPRKQYGTGYMYFRRKNTKVFGRILNWIGGDVYVPVLWQAPVLDGNAFPVVLFTHGLGGNRTTYTTVCSDIASHGFIVAAIEHRDGSASMTYCFKQPESNNNNAINDDGSTDCDHKMAATTDDCDPESDSSSDSEENMSGACNGLKFQEHWLWYERQQIEDDFDVRHKQVHKNTDVIIVVNIT